MWCQEKLKTMLFDCVFLCCFKQCKIYIFPLMICELSCNKAWNRDFRLVKQRTFYILLLTLGKNWETFFSFFISKMLEGAFSNKCWCWCNFHLKNKINLYSRPKALVARVFFICITKRSLFSGPIKQFFSLQINYMQLIKCPILLISVDI